MFLPLLDFKSQFFKVSQKKLSRLSKPHSTCTEEHIGWFFLKKLHQRFSFRVFERKLFALPAIFLGRAVKIAVYMCKETFWAKLKTWKKKFCLFFTFSDSKRKILRTFGGKSSGWLPKLPSTCTNIHYEKKNK